MSDLQSNITIIKYFWRHASRHPVRLWGMITTVPLAILLHAFLPALIIANILQRLSTGDFAAGDLLGSFGPDIALAVGIGALGSIIVWRINSYFNWTLEGYVIRAIQQEIFDHLMRLSAAFHANRFGGSLVSQANKLSGAYVRVADTTMFQLSTLVWTLVFTNILLWNRALTFVLMLDVFAVVYICCAALLTRSVREASQKHADAENEQTGHLADAVTNVMAVKSFAASKTESLHYGTANEKVRVALMGSMVASLKAQNVFSIVGNIINLVAITMAVASVVIYNADLATVFLVFTYTMNIREQLWQFSGQALRNYNRAFGDAKAMIDILAIEPEVQDPAKPQKSRIRKGAIKFDHMDFTHPDSNADDSLFASLNLHIAAGVKIGLVGYSGSGKTTLTKLLLRFNDIDGGAITIDGQDIASITQDDLRRAISYVPQEPLLFHRSVRENIAYGKPDATDEEIREAARKAYASEFIEALPKGYDTLVGERGVKLSGGQRQRVAIARAILKDAPILVLDEATSALDSESEKLIQAALWELMKNRTAIVIAHRLSTIQKMDRIIVLDQGNIAEEGTHSQLLTRKGTYAKLWSHQSGGFLDE
jgi:ATP-binding cassette subfamily B protein